MWRCWVHTCGCCTQGTLCQLRLNLDLWLGGDLKMQGQEPLLLALQLLLLLLLLVLVLVLVLVVLMPSL